MKTIFRTAFYLRSNYVNKDGKTPVMLRIYLNNELLSLGSTGIAVEQSLWDKENEKLKGRTTDVLSTNLELDNIRNGLQSIYRKLEDNPDVCLKRIKSEYLSKKEYFTQGLLKWDFSLVFPKVSPPPLLKKDWLSFIEIFILAISLQVCR